MDDRRWTVEVTGRAFQPVGVGHQRMGNIDRRPPTADRRRTGFPACQGSGPSTNGERMNEFRLQTAVGQAFQPVREVGRQRMGERINEFRPQTADRGVNDGRWIIDRGRRQHTQAFRLPGDTVNEGGTHIRLFVKKIR